MSTLYTRYWAYWVFYYDTDIDWSQQNSALASCFAFHLGL